MILFFNQKFYKEEGWEGNLNWYNLEYSKNKFRTLGIAQPNNSNGKYIIILSSIIGENTNNKLLNFTFKENTNIIGGIIKTNNYKNLSNNDIKEQKLFIRLLNKGITLIFLTQYSKNCCAYLSGVLNNKCNNINLYWMLETNIKKGKLRKNNNKTLLMSIKDIYPNDINIKSNYSENYITDGRGVGSKFKLLINFRNLNGIQVLESGKNYKLNDNIIFKNLLTNNRDLILKLGLNDIENISMPSKDYQYYLYLFYLIKYKQQIFNINKINYKEVGLIGSNINGNMISRLINEFSNKSSSYWVVNKFLKSHSIYNDNFWPNPLFAIISDSGSLKSRDFDFCKLFDYKYNNKCSCHPIFPFKSNNEYKQNKQNISSKIIKTSLNLGLEPIYNWNIIRWQYHVPTLTIKINKYDEPNTYINILNYKTNYRFNYKCLSFERTDEIYEFIIKHINRLDNIKILNTVFIFISLLILSLIIIIVSILKYNFKNNK